MYERFYNLRERPFNLSPDPDYLYRSKGHSEALGYLRYGIEGRAGFVVITGEIGSGKTTLLQATLRRIDRRTAVARLVSTLLDDHELLEAVMLDFGLDPPPGSSKPYLLRDLARFLVDQRRAGRLSLLVIDEAQNLSPAALEEIRMLSNLETEKSKLIQIVLVGQPNLHDLLDQPELEQLRQRVTVRYHLRALDPDETASYINHRLQKAALGEPLVFPVEATDLIGRASGGLPRRINVIADAALLFGYSDDKKTIDAALVQEVIGELESTGVLAAARPPADVATREARVALRERQMEEQQRILTEQHRIIRQRESQLFGAAPAAVRSASGARPTAHTQPQSASAPVGATAFGPVDGPPSKAAASRRAEAVSNPSLWSRLRRGLFATGHTSLARDGSPAGLLDKEVHP